MWFSIKFDIDYLESFTLKTLNSYLLNNKQSVKKILNFLIILASLILIINISIESFNNDSFLKHSIYFDIQFWICIFFTVIFLVFCYLSDNKIKFLFRYSILLLLSIPYLAILDYSSIHLNSEQIYLISFIPLVRGGVALIMMILLLVERNTTALLISYIILLFSTIYFISLIFFIFERNVNWEVTTYSDAIWWAGMTVTTVGSEIVPITQVGKIVTTILAATGMTTFPVFTVYFTSVVNRLSNTKK